MEKKVKKRIKIKMLPVIIVLIIALVCYLGYSIMVDLPIKNIYIIGNNILSDREIIEIAGIEDYPSFMKTSKKDIITKLEKISYIKEVKIEKKFYNKIYIYITENKVLALYNNKIILENNMIIDNTYNITTIPILTSDITNIKDKFIEKFSLINNDILLKISEINYAPNDVDNERFSLKMNDGNLVYVTLSKINKINKYNSIYSKMEEKKGIIYLDSGDYVEVKEG